MSSPARVDVGDRLEDLELRRADGTPVRLTEVIDRLTIIPIVRYYGCMPCRDFLLALEEHRHDLDSAGVAVLGVGRAADFQAAHLMESGIGYELLVDPDEHMYHALDLRRFPWWRMLDPRTWRNYVRSLRRARQGRITNHPLQSPGVVALDADLRVRYLHRGATIGDYPPVQVVIDDLLQAGT